MTNKLLSIFFFSIILFGCKENSNSQSDTNDNSSSNISEFDNTNGYDDGYYCAEVSYYYSKTGTNSLYTLKVEIENNELVKIYWPNGGWLDNSHFSPPSISDGNATFESDRGVEYTIKIIGEDGECNYSTNVQDEDELIEESETQKIDGVTGTVIWDSYSCDYVVIYTENNWYIIAQKYSGAYNLSEGDKVRGDLVGFGFEDVYCINKEKEMRLYIDNYYATKSSAEELIIEKCNLSEE